MRINVTSSTQRCQFSSDFGHSGGWWKVRQQGVSDEAPTPSDQSKSAGHQPTWKLRNFKFDSFASGNVACIRISLTSSTQRCQFVRFSRKSGDTALPFWLYFFVQVLDDSWRCILPRIECHITAERGQIVETVYTLICNNQKPTKLKTEEQKQK